MESLIRGVRYMHPYLSSVIADYILKLANERGEALTPLKLIKLVYICHGWMLALYNRPLLSDPIEAWPYGPVVRSLYDKVKEFKSSPVTVKLSDQNEDLDEDAKKLINQVVDRYSNFSAIDLSNMAHAPDTPWSKTWNAAQKTTIISNDLIEDYFKDLYKEYTQKQAIA